MPRLQHTRLALLLIPTLLGPACGGGNSEANASSSNDSEGSGGSTSSGGSNTSGAGSPETVGTFQVELVSAVEATAETDARDAFVSILGRVYEHPTPELVVWELTDEAAGCQLFVPRVPFCDPACTGGEVCIEDQTCSAFPQSFDLGRVTLEGIATESGSPVTMDPLPPSNTYQPLASAGIIYPPFSSGDPVSLQTEGGDLEAFGMSATGIEELVLTQPTGALPFASGEPAQFAWEASEGDGTHIEVVIDISHHGGQKGEIRCEVLDTGSLSIPAQLVTGLIDLGFSGFPTVRIARVALGSAQTSAGQVRLKLVHAIDRFIEIPGLVSCPEAGLSDGCPEAEVCQDDLKCG